MAVPPFTPLVVSLGLTFALFLGTLGGCSGAVGEPLRPAPDYNEYVYGSADEKVVDLGSVPTGMTGFFSQALLHDRILRSQLAGQGWTLREHPFQSGNDMMTYSDGRLDLGFVGDLPGLLMVTRFPVGVVALSREGYNTLIGRQHLTAVELKGRRIGFPRLTTAHSTVLQVLSSAGLKMKDVVSVPLGADQWATALGRGQVDVVSAWEPQASSILTSVRGALPLARLETYNLVVLDLPFAEQNPTVARQVLAALLRATHWAQADEEHIRQGLRWSRGSAEALTGTVYFDDSAPWVSLFRRESVDNPSFPLLPLGFEGQNGRAHQLFTLLAASGELPPEVTWSSLQTRIDTKMMPDLQVHGSQWRVEEFDYVDKG